MKETAPVNASRAALHLVAGGLARGVAGEALLAGFQKLLRPAVIETLGNVLASTQRGDALFAAQTFKNNTDLFFCRMVPSRLATDVPDDLLGRAFLAHRFLSHLCAHRSLR